MPIFKVGSFDNIGVRSAGGGKVNVIRKVHKQKVKFPAILSVSALPEISFNIEAPDTKFAQSKEKWGLNLKSITLNDSFEGFIANLFNPDNEIYFISTAWDYSGAAPAIWPPRGTDPSQFIFKMKKGTTRKFIGDGVNLWPAQRVTGALNLVLFVYEGDADDRKTGEQLESLHGAIEDSSFPSLLKAISMNPALATAAAITGAVSSLLGMVGKVMKQNGDDFVELFEGSYGTDRAQKSRTENYSTESAGIELEFTTST